jgi:glycosyltransferase involved in cell wall biosynthesis
MSGKSKILVLSWGMPPAINGSGIVLQNLLKQFNNRYMVAVGAYGKGTPAPLWDPAWPRIIYGMYQPLRTCRWERWICRMQFPALFAVSLITLLRYRCEAVFTTYPDQFFLLTGYLLARLFNKPLFVYFQNTYQDSKAGSRFAEWLEERIFSRARHVFVISRGMQEHYQKKYPALPCTLLPHVIDGIHGLPKNFTAPAFHRPIRLLFAGNINESCCEAAGRFLRLTQEHPDFTLRIYSGMNASDLKRIGFSGERITSNQVPYDELLEHMREADILIHPHGFNGPMTDTEYRTIFPTKTLEYLISQRPILAHMPSECYISQFYRKHHCALVVNEPSVEALFNAVQRLKNRPELRTELVKNAVRASGQFSGRRISELFKSTVEKYMREKKGRDFPARIPHRNGRHDAEPFKGTERGGLN